MKRLLPLLLLVTAYPLLTLTWAQPSHRQPAIDLATADDQVSLAGQLFYYQDSLRNDSSANVTNPPVDAAFQPARSPVPNFGFISDQSLAQPVWLRFRVFNATQQPQQWLTEIDFWCFDELQVFTVDERRRTLSRSPRIGWKTPVTQRPRYHRHYWFPVTAPAGQATTVYLRALKHRGTQIIPVNLIRASAYESTVQLGFLYWGGLLFTLVFVAVISLFFALTTFKRIYVKYVLCLLGLLGFFFINCGFMNQFAFEQQFWLPRQNIYFLFPLILFYSQLFFIRTFLSLRRTPAHHWHTVNTVSMWCGLLCVFILTGEFISPYGRATEQFLLTLFVCLYWLPLPIMGAYIVINIHRRYQVREAWLYLIAVGPFYALNLGQTLASMGLMPTYAFITDFVNFGLAALFEVLILSFGIAYSYKLSRDEMERLSQERNRQQQRTFEAEVQTLALKNNLLIEKTRIARDLHDNVGAHLAFVVTNLTHISKQAEKDPAFDARHWAGQLRSIVTHTRDAIKLLRETIWAIHRESFTTDEFAERLNQYIDRYFQENGGLHVDVRVDGEQAQPLSSTQVLNLFRIVQEALTNVTKHAHATQALVQLDVRASGRISLRIHDNGRGFGWSSETNNGQHYGLQNMQTRAQELGGTFRVYADEGTTIEVDV